VNLQRLAVGRHRDGPIAIGAPDVRAGGDEIRKRGPMRMSESVSMSYGNNRFLWIDGTQKLGRRRRPAAVVAHLEHVCAQLLARIGEQNGLFFVLRISNEQQRPPAERNSQDERVVVRASIGRRLGARGQNLDVCPPDCVRTADSIRAEDGDTLAARSIEKGRVRTANLLPLPLSRIPKLAHSDCAEACQQSDEVIGVRMRQDGGRDGRAATCAQLGSQNTRSNVDWAADQAASVDHHRRAIGQVDDRSVSLAHIQKRGPQYAMRLSDASCPQLEHEHSSGEDG